MADLTALPTVEFPLDFQPKLVDVGPDLLDAATIDRFLELGAGGVLQFTRDPSPELDAVSLEDLTRLFALHLHGDTPTTHFALEHRVYSLMWAARDLIAANDSATLALGGLPITTDRAIGSLELWLAQKREAWAAVNPDADPERAAFLFDKLLLVTPAEVTWLTGIPVNTLAAWRSQNKGPQFANISGARSTIRYPAVALLDWLVESR